MAKKIRSRAGLVLVAVLALWALGGSLQNQARADPAVNAVGLQGYDPVAYFTGGAPAKGTWGFFTTYKGVIYRFSSRENERAFRDNPEKYLPQFGGFCAFGMAQNNKLPTEPEAWHIRDGKLYVFLNDDFRSRWLADPEGNLEKGKANWTGLRGTVPRPLQAAADEITQQ